MKPLKKNCLQCGKIIIKKPSCSLKNWKNRTKYCSRFCLGKSCINNPVWLEKQKISHLGKKASLKTKIKMSIAHKREKTWNWKGGKPKCEICKKMITYGFKRCLKHRIFSKCWRENIRKANLGEKSHLWKGGITPINRKIRGSLQYKLWREAVMKRDDWTCLWCRQRGGNLEVDHINQFAYHPELRFDVNNGRTLCSDCHKKTSTYSHKQ